MLQLKKKLDDQSRLVNHRHTELFVTIFRHLKLGLLTQIPA